MSRWCAGTGSETSAAPAVSRGRSAVAASGSRPAAAGRGVRHGSRISAGAVWRVGEAIRSRTSPVFSFSTIGTAGSALRITSSIERATADAAGSRPGCPAAASSTFSTCTTGMHSAPMDCSARPMAARRGTESRGPRCTARSRSSTDAPVSHWTTRQGRSSGLTRALSSATSTGRPTAAGRGRDTTFVAPGASLSSRSRPLGGRSSWRRMDRTVAAG